MTRQLSDSLVNMQNLTLLVSAQIMLVAAEGGVLSQFATLIH